MPAVYGTLWPSLCAAAAFNDFLNSAAAANGFSLMFQLIIRSHIFFYFYFLWFAKLPQAKEKKLKNLQWTA